MQRANWSPESALVALGVKTDAVWRAGERGMRGKIHAESGANVSISDAPTMQQLLTDIRQFFELRGEAVAALVAEGVAVELDVGVTVGDSEQYIASVRFESADLRLIATLGISLSVSAYPTSDQANAQTV